MAENRRAWRRGLLAVAALSAGWAAIVTATGGFDFRFGAIRIASRNPVDPALIAITCAAIAVTLDWKSRNSRTSRALIVVVTFLGVALVVWQWADARPLWLDEEMITLNVRDRSLRSLAGRLWLEQTAPLGWLWLQRLSLLTFGSTELAVRLVPALFGVATVIAAAWTGHRWMTPIGNTAFVLLCSFGLWLSFYSVELKHYSADTAFGIFVPALAVWAADGHSERLIKYRLLIWGAVASLGLWLSVGGLLILPACGIVVAVKVLRRFGFRAVPQLTAVGLIIAVSFAAHYMLALRHARESRFFQEFWSFAFPPASAGMRETISWFGTQLQPFAMKPGGTGLWLSFWLTAAAGFTFARRRDLGAIGALIVLSGFVLAASRVMPFYERVSLWFLPSIYLGIALFADSAVTFAAHTRNQRPWLHFAAAITVGAVAFQLCADILRRGVDDMRVSRPAQTNRYVDDRSALAWLMAQRQTGDVLITTRFGLPAVWWYGGMSIAGEAGRLPDGSPMFITQHRAPNDCAEDEVSHQMAGRSRALIYFGFEDYPKWLDDVVLRDLGRVGAVTTVRHFGTISRAAVVDFRLPRGITTPQWLDSTDLVPPGCAIVHPAAKW